jgi:HD-like signal output (HDOD) protein
VEEIAPSPTVRMLKTRVRMPIDQPMEVVGPAPAGKRILFVDDEPALLEALQLAVAAAPGEWTLTFAPTGIAALDLMSRQPFDVVVTDMRMPVLDGGASLLATVRDQYPRVARIVLSDEADRETVLRTVGSAHRYLSRPCEPAQLTVAIGETLAVRDTLHNDALRSIVSRVQSLPSLPTLYIDILEELNRPEPRITTISQIVEHDVAMTAKLLQLVNSAYFGRPGRTADVQEAVQFLGVETLQALVLGVHVFSSMHCAARHFSPTGLWRHSVATSALAGAIARYERLPAGAATAALTAGLLHDCGKLLLASVMPTEFDALVIRARRESTPAWRVEQDALGCTHAEIGAYLLGLWGLPDPVVAAVAFHHRPADSGNQKFTPVTAVHAANAIMDNKQYGAPPDMVYLERLGLKARYAEWARLTVDDARSPSTSPSSSPSPSSSLLQ